MQDPPCSWELSFFSLINFPTSVLTFKFIFGFVRQEPGKPVLPLAKHLSQQDWVEAFSSTQISYNKLERFVLNSWQSNCKYFLTKIANNYPFFIVYINSKISVDVTVLMDARFASLVEFLKWLHPLRIPVFPWSDLPQAA
jgi:hypothetical protein